jgi:poly(3-hydroxybutyrate) depolymerase
MVSHVLRSVCLAAALAASCPSHAADPARGPADLALTFRSPASGRDQPFRLYLPSGYDGQKPMPLLVALHGTGGDHNKYFDHPAYGDGIYRREAEKRGIVLLCPSEGDPLNLPTEWRGLGEVNVLALIEEVCRRFRIDRDRIVLSGQSMGGTGTTYLCCRYPELFAAGIPLASTYGHLTLVENLRHVPMFYVQGEKDWPVYANDGPIPITKRMSQLGYNGQLWIVAGEGHNTMLASTERVLEWALQQRRVAHPRRVTFRAYLPIHGKAYWTEIQAIEHIGRFAEIDAAIEPGNVVAASIANAAQVAIRPEPELLDMAQPIEVRVNGCRVFHGSCNVEEEIRLVLGSGGWRGQVAARNVRPLTAYRTHKIGTAVDPPTQTGAAETSMGNWMADAIRDAAGADIAIYNRGHYRGVPLEKGQDVYLVDLINWIRPTERCLSLLEITGRELLEIIEDNIRNEAKDARFLVQVSGCRYAFDRGRPQGQRIVESDIDPERTYSVVCESHSLTRTDTMNLAGRYGKIPYRNLDWTSISTAWRFINRSNGRIEGRLEGRVKDVTARPPEKPPSPERSS